MKKAINISALLFFIWLLLDALDIPQNILMFLLMGELPGTRTSLPPTVMLSLMTAIIGIVSFELLARRVTIVRRIRQQAMGIMARREKLPRRRFTQI